jgi:hypothetical protein
MKKWRIGLQNGFLKANKALICLRIQQNRKPVLVTPTSGVLHQELNLLQLGFGHTQILSSFESSGKTTTPLMMRQVGLTLRRMQPQ